MGDATQQNLHPLSFYTLKITSPHAQVDCIVPGSEGKILFCSMFSCLRLVSPNKATDPAMQAGLRGPKSACAGSGIKGNWGRQVPARFISRARVTVNFGYWA